MTRNLKVSLILLSLVFAGLSPATFPVGAGAQESLGSDSGLPLPRFVSLRQNEVNARTGPGIEKPIAWIYHRLNLPVEVYQEFGDWRRVRDWQGEGGWIHRSLLESRRGFIVDTHAVLLRRAPSDTASPVAQLQVNVVGLIRQCDGGWCYVEVGGFRGYLLQTDFFGTYPGEIIE